MKMDKYVKKFEFTETKQNYLITALNVTKL